MASRARTNGDAPELGDAIEQWACERFPLEYVDETYYDAVGQYGRKVQIKGAKRWIQNGYTASGTPKRTRGRWKLWSDDHAMLQRDDGVYLLVVYEEGDDGIEPLAWRFVSPAAISESTPDEWYDIDDPRTAGKGQTYRLPWRDVLDPEVVDHDG